MAAINQLEISSKCDIKSENSSTLCKNHKRGKGPFDGVNECSIPDELKKEMPFTAIRRGIS